jgi:glycosyltransferase involved in cell wall biosynthesis
MVEPRELCVVIPAYNEATVIGGVVRQLVNCGYLTIVIDDGSIDATGVQARVAGALVVRHPINRGQGAALMTGIRFALARSAEIIVTFDADGQHRVDDIGRLVGALEENSLDVAVGSRFLGRAPEIGAVRALLLRTAALVQSWSTGVAMTDAHNGLRAIRRRAAEKLFLRQDRMAHASEFMRLVVEQGLSLGEVPVEIRYTTYSKRKGQTLAGAVDILMDLAVNWLRRQLK